LTIATPQRSQTLRKRNLREGLHHSPRRKETPRPSSQPLRKERSTTQGKRTRLRKREIALFSAQRRNSKAESGVARSATSLAGRKAESAVARSATSLAGQKAESGVARSATALAGQKAESAVARSATSLAGRGSAAADAGLAPRYACRSSNALRGSPPRVRRAGGLLAPSPLAFRGEDSDGGTCSLSPAPGAGFPPVLSPQKNSQFPPAQGDGHPPVLSPQKNSQFPPAQGDGHPPLLSPHNHRLARASLELGQQPSKPRLT